MMDGLYRDLALESLEFGRDADPETGLIVNDPECAVNLLPIPVRKNSRVRPASEGIFIRVLFYRPEIPPELIHTYCYQPEANWSTYCAELSDREWTADERRLTEDGFIRVAVKPAESGKGCGDCFSIEEPLAADAPAPEWMEVCCSDLVRRVRASRREGDLCLLLLSDTHYTCGCIWPDTVRSLRMAAERLHPDGLIHLGDFTDGLLPEKYTRRIAQRILAELKTIAEPVWCCIGNHDRNYFRGNPGRISGEECARLYLQRETPWFYADCPQSRLRMLFLDSFDPEEKERYGFPMKEVRWVRRTLRTTPKGYRVLIFSHVTPLASLHVWSDTIRNESRMLRVVERFHARRKGAVLGWIHGHSHADQIHTGRAFPVIGIGCSKLEDFPEHKPAGSATWKREQHTETQELWDVLLVHRENGGLDLLRFGAGEDRHMEGKTET